MEEAIPVKLRQCYGIYDSDNDRQHRHPRTALLCEVMDYFSNDENTITEEMYNETVNMFAVCSFQASQPSAEDDPDIAMFNDLVFGAFLNFLDLPNFDIVVAKKYFTETFVLDLMNLFDIEIKEKRVCLVQIMYQIYLKHLVPHSFIRTTAKNILLTFMTTQRHHGISELLEFLESVIFMFPLNDESFLLGGLLPLYSTKYISSFSSQLTDCVLEFFELNSKLTEPFVLGFLNIWPKTNSSKEAIFLNELHKIMKVMEPNEFGKVATPISKQLARSLLSRDPQVIGCSIDIFLSYFRELPNLSAIVYDGGIRKDGLSALHELFLKSFDLSSADTDDPSPPENSSDDSSIIDISEESDGSILVSNASDIFSIATNQLEAMKTSSSTTDATPKGILNNGIPAQANMKVRFVKKKIVHIIPSDHDGKPLKTFRR